jgi:hypothetical protein
VKSTLWLINTSSGKHTKLRHSMTGPLWLITITIIKPPVADCTKKCQPLLLLSDVVDGKIWTLLVIVREILPLFQKKVWDLGQDHFLEVIWSLNGRLIAFLNIINAKKVFYRALLTKHLRPWWDLPPPYLTSIPKNVRLERAKAGLQRNRELTQNRVSAAITHRRNQIWSSQELRLRET